MCKNCKENDSKQPSALELLPQEIKKHIFSSLELSDIRALRQLNENHKSFVDNNSEFLSNCIQNLLDNYQAAVHKQISEAFHNASEDLKNSACYLMEGDSPFEIFMSTWTCQQQEMLDLLKSPFLTAEGKEQLTKLLKEEKKHEYTLENFIARNTLLNAFNDNLIPYNYSLHECCCTRLGPNTLSSLEKKNSRNKPFSLQLSRDNLQRLPSFLSRLSNLTTIIANWNKLRFIPQFITAMPNLTCFDAYGNKILALSKETETFLKKLETKNLGAMGLLTEIKQPFENMKAQNFKAEDLNSNPLEAANYVLGRKVTQHLLDINAEEPTKTDVVLQKIYSPAFRQGVHDKLAGTPNRMSEKQQRKLEADGILPPRKIRFSAA